MKSYALIALLLLIIISIYFIYKKAKIDYFSVPLTKPNLIIKTGDNLLWINNNFKNIQIDTSNFSTKFLSTNFVSYTNRSINNSTDYYQGFYFQSLNSLSNIKIGLQNGKLQDFQTPIENLDFAFHFQEGNKLQIEEKFNPYLETLAAKGSYQYVDINYCHSRPKKKCERTRNSFDIGNTQNIGFAILIFDNLVNYILIKDKENNDKSAILIHQSRNKINYPLYPVILNQKNDNIIKEFNWCVSDIVPPPTIYNAELLNPVKYEQESLPPQESLYRFSPQPSSSDLDLTPAEPPALPIYPWDRKLEILNARLDNESKMLSLFVKTINMNQTYLDRLYGVSIILSLSTKNKKHKTLNIPYIPLIQVNDLTLDANNVVKMSLSLADHLTYFYQKDLQVKVVFRLGEFTTNDNIHSPNYLLEA